MKEKNPLVEIRAEFFVSIFLANSFIGFNQPSHTSGECSKDFLFIKGMYE